MIFFTNSIYVVNSVTIRKWIQYYNNFNFKRFFEDHGWLEVKNIHWLKRLKIDLGVVQESGAFSLE